MSVYRVSGIYTIISLINNKIYVGCSNNLGKRLSGHLKALEKNKHGNIHLQSAWNKHGRENFKFELLIECEKEFLLSEENYWCNLLDAHNPKFGYNIQPTSPFGNLTNSKETRAKIGAAKKGCIPWITGKHHTEETRKKMRKAREDFKHTAETKIKMSKAHEGIIPKNIELFRQSTIGRKRTTEELLNQSIRQKKPITQYDLNMNFIKIWVSAKDAVIELGFKDPSQLTRCARRNSDKVTAHGFIWRYDSERFVNTFI